MEEPHDGEHHLTSHQRLRGQHMRLRMAYMTLFEQYLDLLELMRLVTEGKMEDEEGDSV